MEQEVDELVEECIRNAEDDDSNDVLDSFEFKEPYLI